MQTHILLLSDNEPYVDTDKNADSYVEMGSDSTIDKNQNNPVISNRGRKGEAYRQYRQQTSCKTEDILTKQGSSNTQAYISHNTIWTCYSRIVHKPQRFIY